MLKGVLRISAERTNSERNNPKSGNNPEQKS